MSEPTAIRLSGVGKMYKIFPTRLDNLLDALGLARLVPWRRAKAREFWALRDINLDLKARSRLGIIGRNGAGKSTLLKLITGNLPPTEGEITVNGQVQALMEAGAGFHPEFTGRENVRASLTYRALDPAAIEVALEDIAEFTELGSFLDQPFKTYSSGMQARLVFATATVLKPDILIVDEILGAGDAYFASKSNERMKQLVVESGASVLLVSHAVNSILQFCDEAIWIERGRIVQRGPSLDVVNAYEAFIHSLDERRLRVRNQKAIQRKLSPSIEQGLYSDAISLQFVLRGRQGAVCDVALIQLLRDGQIDEEIKVGDVQDATPSFTAFISMEGSRWSEPKQTGHRPYRSLIIEKNGANAIIGYATFYSYGLFDNTRYSIRITYRCPQSANLSLSITKNGSMVQNQVQLPTGHVDWASEEFAIVSMTGTVSQLPTASGALDMSPPIGGSGFNGVHRPQTEMKTLTKWPGEGSLTIEHARPIGADQQEKAVFMVGESMMLNLSVLAHRDGHFNLVLGATLIRTDGVYISNFVSPPLPVDLVYGESREFRLNIPALMLGNGDFVFSLSIFEGTVQAETRYDLVARAYQFKVVGNLPLVAQAIFQHPAEWETLPSSAADRN